MSDAGFCVCVPVRNEVGRLPVLLDALAAQTVAGQIPVSLCINNSDDGSAVIAADYALRHVSRLDLRIDDCVLPTKLANAGIARGRAMDAGLALVGARGVLISTDADCRPPSEWIAANLAAIAGGADVVGGRIVLDDAEPIASDMAALRARFDRYWAAVRAIEDDIDPSPDDPPPRHGDHTGASLAIGAALYRDIGGVPAIPCGEDRALVIAAVAAGARLAHPASVWTRVSGRTDGRVSGGMATAMADWSVALRNGHDPRVAAFDHWRSRAAWRRAERTRTGVAAMVASEQMLPPMPADMALPR